MLRLQAMPAGGAPTLLLVALLPLAEATPFRPTSHEELKGAVKLWCSNETLAIPQYGLISQWDVTQVTNMNLLFNDQFYCNPAIGSWDVSNVLTMNHMFDNARSFNAPINSWDMTNVIEMCAMFNKASAFNQDISLWDIANVVHGAAPMRHMFREADALSSCNKFKINAAWKLKNSKWPYQELWAGEACS